MGGLVAGRDDALHCAVQLAVLFDGRGCVLPGREEHKGVPEFDDCVSRRVMHSVITVRFGVSAINLREFQNSFLI